MKKIKPWVIILIVGLIIIAVAVTIFASQRKKAGIVNGQINSISNEEILFPTLNKTANSIIYFNNQNEAAFYKIDLSGQNKTKVSNQLDTPDGVIWSPKKDKAILQVTYNKFLFEQYGSPFSSPRTPDGAITFWTYDFTNRELTQLNLDVNDVIWSSDGEKIIYSYYNPKSLKNQVNIADPDGSNWKILLSPNQNVQNIFYYGAADKELVFGVDSLVDNQEKYFDLYSSNNGQDPKLLLSKIDIGSVSVSPDGKSLICSKNNKIYFIDLVKKKGQPLNIKATKDIVGWTQDSQSFFLASRDKGNTDEIRFAMVKDLRLKEINYGNISIDAGSLMPIDQKTLYLISNNLLYKLTIL